jgi:hypothetical protein
MAAPKGEFVPLSSVRTAAREPADVLSEIRQIYFRTTRETIHADLAHAIALLKSLPTEDLREKATVYMDGLAQMRSEWAGKRAKAPGPNAKGKGARPHGSNRRTRRGSTKP